MDELTTFIVGIDFPNEDKSKSNRYMEGWEPAARDTWNRNCIGRLLNCSDGELGDGTMLKRGALDYRAASRLMVAPAL